MAIRAEEDYRERVEALILSLGIPVELVAARSLELQAEPELLVVAETGRDGRMHQLVPEAADAWRAMRAAARADGVVLEIVSAFRNLEQQVRIVSAKLARGQTPEQIFSASAPPGYSEHHSGRAVDLTTDGVAPLEPQFEDTTAYSWLSKHAEGFSFFLSFPRGNRYGYIFEPWHWCFRREMA